METNAAENLYSHETAESFNREFNENIEFVSIITPSEQLDGIEILVSMAKSGKIDPWN
jgi:hypothetical protein